MRIHWGEQGSGIKGENILGESRGQVSKVRIHWGTAWVGHQR